MINDVTAIPRNLAPVPAAAETQPLPLRDKLGQIVARTVQNLSRDIEDRKMNWKTDVKKVYAGAWSQNTYYTMLQTANQAQYFFNGLSKKTNFIMAILPAMLLN